MTGSEARFEDRTGPWTRFEAIACLEAGDVDGVGAETDEISGTGTEANGVADASAEADGVSRAGTGSSMGSHQEKALTVVVPHSNHVINISDVDQIDLCKFGNHAIFATRSMWKQSCIIHHT